LCDFSVASAPALPLFPPSDMKFSCDGLWARQHDAM